MSGLGAVYLKILQIGNKVAWEFHGGHERYVTELAQALHGSGHEVTLFSKSVTGHFHPPAGEGPRWVNYKMPPKAGRTTYAIRSVIAPNQALWRSALLREAWDVIHAHYPLQGALLPTLGKRYVYTFHAPISKEIEVGSGAVARSKVLAVRRLERRVLDGAEHVITLSHFMAEQALMIAPDIAPRLSIIAGGVKEVPACPAAVRVPYQIFCARRLVERTGVANLIEAFSAIAAVFPSARLRISGVGPEQPRLTALVKTLNLQSRVAFLGWLSEAELDQEYRRCHVAVTPTLELEGFGLATAEAAVRGAPVIVTPVGANPELVDGASMLVAASPRSSDIANALTALLSQDPDKLFAVALAASHASSKRWGWSVVTSAHRAIYGALQAH